MPEETNGPEGEEGQETQEPQEDVEGDGQQPKEQGAPVYTEEEFQQTLKDTMNRVVPDRVSRAQRSLLKDLGFEDAEAAKEAFTELKKLRLEQMSEQERRDAELRDAQERAERAESERDQARAEAQDRLLRAAFLAEAGRRGAKYPDDAFKLADLTNVSIADGVIEGVEEAVQALIDGGRLILTGRPQAPPLDGGAGSGDRPGAKVKLTPEELEMAQKLGVKPEDYAKHKPE